MDKNFRHIPYSSESDIFRTALLSWLRNWFASITVRKLINEARLYVGQCTTLEFSIHFPSHHIIYVELTVVSPGENKTQYRVVCNHETDALLDVTSCPAVANRRCVMRIQSYTLLCMQEV